MIEKSELTFKRLLPVWWAFTWRAMLVGVVGGMAAGFVLGVVMGLLGLAAYIQPIALVAGVCIAAPVGVWALRSALTKRYGNFQFQLMTPANHF